MMKRATLVIALFALSACQMPATAHAWGGGRHAHGWSSRGGYAPRYVRPTQTYGPRYATPGYEYQFNRYQARTAGGYNALFSM